MASIHVCATTEQKTALGHAQVALPERGDVLELPARVPPHVEGGELEQVVVASRATIVEISPDTGLNRERKGRIKVKVHHFAGFVFFRSRVGPHQSGVWIRVRVSDRLANYREEVGVVW